MAGKDLALQILLKARDMASDVIAGVEKSVSNVGTTAGKVGTSLSTMGTAITAGVGAAAGAVFGLAASATDTELLAGAFDNLSRSIGETSETMLGEMRAATMGTLSDTQLMAAGNKLMAMGLADSAEKAGELAEMATTLGLAMGTGAGPALENFTLMLANQSILRLDTFGISSGEVRKRIDELTESIEGMTREQAFMQAVMEQGTISMATVGDQSDKAAVKMSALKADMANLKDQVGMALIPVLTALITPLAELATEHGPKIIAFVEKLMEKFDNLPASTQKVIAIVGALAAALTGASLILGPVVGLLGPLAGGLGGVLAALTGPVGIAIALVAGLALAWTKDFLGIRTALTPLMEDVKAFGGAIKEGFQEGGVTGAVEAMATGLGDLVSSFQDKLPDLGTSFGEIIGKLFGLALTFLTEKLPEYIKQFADWVGGIIDGMNSPENRSAWSASIFQAIKNAWASFKAALIANGPEWVGDVFDWIDATLKGAVDKVKQAADLFNKFKEIGTNIIAGIKQGMEDMKDSIKTWIIDFLKKILPDWAEGALGISSPSKVFAEIGKNMALGLGVGWDKNIPGIGKGIAGSLGGLAGAPVGATSTIGGWTNALAGSGMGAGASFAQAFADGVSTSGSMDSLAEAIATRLVGGLIRGLESAAA